MNSNKLNAILECSDYFGNKHFTKNPILLSCGHTICYECRPHDTKTIRCFHCFKMSEFDENRKQELPMFDLLFDFNLNEMQNTVLNRLETTYRMYKYDVSNVAENLKAKIQNSKEEIQLRTESLKLQLDKLCEEFCDELDQSFEKWKMNKNNVYSKLETEEFEKEIDQLKLKLNNNNKLTNKEFYYYQDKLKELDDLIVKFKTIEPSIKFINSNAEIEREDLIGKIDQNYFEVDWAISRLSSNKFKEISIHTSSCYDLCVLDNGNVLVADFDGSQLLVYDASLKLIKKVRMIGNYTFEPYSLVTDNNYLFISDCQSRFILKANLSFEFIAMYKGTHKDLFDERPVLYDPRGLCLYEDKLYVCDTNYQRIFILSKDLNVLDAFKFEMYPVHIKITNNVALINFNGLSGLTFYPSNIGSIGFYSLPKFQKIADNIESRGIISSIGSNFYIYNKDNIIFCYDEKANISKRFSIKNMPKLKLDSIGGIVKHKNNLILYSNGINQLFIF